MVTKGSVIRGILFFFALRGSLRSPDLFPPSLGADSQATSLAARSAVRTDPVKKRKERFRVRGHIFTDAFLWLNRQSFSFNDAF